MTGQNPEGRPEGSAEESADGQLTLEDIKPWEGRATAADKVLLGFMIGVPIFYLVMWPVRPFLIAQAPVLLEFLVGAKTVIAAAGAYAGIGELPVWLVVLAGFIGMSKLDWLFWLAGFRWGPRVLNLFASGPQQRRWAQRLQSMPIWLLGILVFIGRFPGIPGALVWLVAGLNGMRLWLFLMLNLLGNLLLTCALVLLGHQLGESAVAVIQMVDRYALWISLGLIVVLVVWQTWRGSRGARTADQG